MWPFKKKHPPLTDLPTGGGWQVLQGLYDGRPIVLRVNAAVDAFRGHPELGYQVGIAVPLKDPSEHGLPKQPELDALSAIEDRLVDTVVVAARSVLVAVVTTGGMREFVLYATDPEEVKKNFARLEASNDSGLELQLMIQGDPEWSVFESFRQRSS
jgi:hypothetical protein